MIIVALEKGGAYANKHVVKICQLTVKRLDNLACFTSVYYSNTKPNREGSANS